jgi:hypothetical protein
MSSAAAVVVCALAVLGRSEASMPRIELVETAPIGSSPQVEAYVLTPGNIIYLVTSSRVFRDAQDTKNKWCSDTLPIKKLASILAHEEWHLRHGGNEKGAYEAQLMTLIRLGVQPGSGLYSTVVRAMMTVLKKQNRKPEMVLAGGREP